MSARLVLPRSPAARWGLAAGLLALASSCGPRIGPRPGTPPKHVLLVTASSFRADHTSAYLYRRPTTAWPSLEADRQAGRDVALDDLAGQGVLFANAYSPSSRTLPALAALFTGTARPVVAGDEHLPLEAWTLAERFAEEGFETAAFLSGIALRRSAEGFDHGFDQGFDVVDYRFGDLQILKLAIDWLRGRESAAPLFLWIHLSGADPPHDPRPLPPRPGGAPGAFDYARYFVDPDYAGAAQGGIDFLRSAAAGEVELSASDRQHIIDLYDGELARAASGLRTFVLSLIDLDEGRIWNDTLFVFAGTHGIGLGERGGDYFAAGSLHADVLRVPLLLRHRNSLTGSRVLADLVGLEDVAPTVCEWFGFEVNEPGPGVVAGRTLLAATDSYVDREFAERAALAVDVDGEQARAALRDAQWTLLWTPGASEMEGGEYQLFDRHADPAERIDIASERPAELARMRALLEERLATWDVPQLR